MRYPRLVQLAAGDVLDRYRLVAKLGSGGQGAVWRASDPMRGGAPVALKLLALAHAGRTDLDRLRREARALAQLRHPSIVGCHGLFEDVRRDLVGLVLDFVEGSSRTRAASSTAT